MHWRKFIFGQGDEDPEPIPETPKPEKTFVDFDTVRDFSTLEALHARALLTLKHSVAPDKIIKLQELARRVEKGKHSEWTLK